MASAYGQEGSGNEYVQALQSIEYDAEETPETQAIAAKERGNVSFQKGKAYHSNAMRFYKEALTHCKQVSFASRSSHPLARLAHEAVVLIDDPLVYR